MFSYFQQVPAWNINMVIFRLKCFSTKNTKLIFAQFFLFWVELDLVVDLQFATVTESVLKCNRDDIRNSTITYRNNVETFFLLEICQLFTNPHINIDNADKMKYTAKIYHDSDVTASDTILVKHQHLEGNKQEITLENRRNMDIQQ